MKLALVIPTRGDRPKFLKQCHHLISRQTLQPDEIIFVDYAPKSSMKDITQRYKKGVEKATKRGCEAVIFWEDDDWYHPSYNEWLINNWVKQRKPSVFGVGETYYYNITANSRLYMAHENRTSMFCTMLKLPHPGPWPADHYPYLDMHLHKRHKVKTVNFPKNQVLAIGIKHGVGMVGGGGHHYRFKWDSIGEKARSWFVNQMDEELTFYDEMSKSLPKNQELAKQRNIYIKNRGKNSKIKNVKKVHRKKVTVSDPSSQLRRRGSKITKIRRR
jgi:glycosyltransferase involved in cell wall biosynthesis